MDTILTVAVYKGFITTFKTVPHTVVIKNACILTCLTARFIGEKKNKCPLPIDVNRHIYIIVHVIEIWDLYRFTKRPMIH